MRESKECYASMQDSEMVEGFLDVVGTNMGGESNNLLKIVSYLPLEPIESYERAVKLLELLRNCKYSAKADMELFTGFADILEQRISAHNRAEGLQL